MTAGQITLIEASALAGASSDVAELARIKLETGMTVNGRELNTTGVKDVITRLRRIEMELEDIKIRLNAGAHQ
jgi:hypothetical protein